MLLRPHLLAVLLTLAACEGSIGEVTLGRRAVPDPVNENPGGLGGPEFNPFEGGTVTFGAVCDADGNARGRVIFTAEAAGCEAHVDILDGATPSGDWALMDTGSPIVAPGRYTVQGDLCLEGTCAVREMVLEVDGLGPSGAIGFWSAPVIGGTATGPLQASECAYDAFRSGPDPDLAPNLAVSEVALYQGVKVPLLRNPLDMNPVTPVIEGRPGLLRVFVEPQPGYLQTSVEAVLSLDQGDPEPSVFRQTREVVFASREASRGTTFEFALEASDLGPDTRWSVALRGTRACSGVGQDTSRARVPSEGTNALEAQKVGSLEVTLVPFRYNADGSGRLPDTSEAQLERYREVLMGMFPVEAVNISVREPVDLELTVTGNSASWGPVLSRLLSLRAEDRPDPNVYYYGIFRPSGGGGWSGTAGLGPVPSAADASRRGAIGLGGTGFGSARTAAHELGHAGGRSHAPCGGAGNPDPNYPYSDGSIGVWGYDILADDLKDPASANDFMGYCGNDWISDYNYRALVNRYSFVNAAPKLGSAPGPRVWRSLYLALDGTAHWEPPVTHLSPPIGEEEPVVFLDADGKAVAEQRSVRVPLDHAEGLLAWIPAPPPGVVGLRLADGRVLHYPSTGIPE